MTAKNQAPQDAWLDNALHDEATQSKTTGSSWLVGVVEGPWRQVRRVTTFLLTTPGKMIGILLLLTIAIFSAGFSMSQSAALRQNELDVLLRSTEPLSYTTHQIYTSLSQADTTATSGFVQPGVESRTSVLSYHTQISKAMTAATETAIAIDDEDAELAQPLAKIQQLVPIYTGMVETARIQNRVGNPVGAAYMSNASALMRDEILPAAAELFALTSDRVGAQQQELSRPQWVPLSGLFASVVLLVLAQIWLASTTHRRLNRGFVVATAFMVLAIAWVSASNYATWQAGSQSFEQASRPWDLLTDSRIEAQQARTAETLALVRRETADFAESEFQDMLEYVSGALDTYAETQDVNEGLIDESREALAEWDKAHQALRIALHTGNYDYARDINSYNYPGDPTKMSSANAYQRLDDSLNKLSTDARESMRAFIGTGLAATHMVASAVLLLAILAILSLWLGIRSRLQEYL